MKKVVLAIGIICILLGGLWLLQGLGAVQIPPILCVAECDAIEGASPVWALVGFLVIAAGALAIFYSLRR